MKIPVYRPSLVDFTLSPHVVECGKVFRFSWRGNGIETALSPDTEYTVRFIPQEQIATAKTLEIGDSGCYPEIKCTADGAGVLHFTHKLESEQIYTFRLLDGEGKRINDSKVFAAKSDLWERIPMRGNAHCHVCCSVDGHEDPVIAASLYRKAGFDYLAITDHHKTDGSVYAVNNMKPFPTEMALYYGEEVHVPNAYLHIVNVGALIDGDGGLDKYYREHKEQVDAAVRDIAAEYKDKLPAGVEVMDFAWRKWVADTIRENGGIAIIAHPFWEYDANNTSNAMLEYLIRTKLFDAVEIIHGQDEPDVTDANRQTAFWNDLRAQGLFIPVVGADDAHRRNYNWDYGSDFNKAFTVVFAKDNSFEGFCEAIRGGYSVAVSHRAGSAGEVTGTYRLTKYAIFLLEYYFPFHDELCFEEGRAIKEAYLGSEDDLGVLKLINGRVGKYTSAFMGRTAADSEA